MGYQQKNGRYADTRDLALMGAVAMTATTNGGAVETDRGVARLTLSVTAASGTNPTLDVAIQTRKDGNDTWRAVASFAQATAAGSERKCFSGLDREVRAVATIAGTTPSFSFSVVGDAA